MINLLILSLISGLLGRMGGAAKSGKWYDFLLNTKTRDAGCSLLTVIAWISCFGLNLSFWWVYIITFGLLWATFTTYWDFLFGFDNLWFSGFVVGLAAIPLTITVPWMIWILIGRAFVLAVIWGLLNKYTPSKVLCWNRDVAEEYGRYAVSI